MDYQNMYNDYIRANTQYNNSSYNINNVNKYLEKFDEILSNMSQKMLSPTICSSITINFIECMVPHHEAAIYMCENLLNYTQYRPLQKIARNIISMQTSGIEEMQKIKNTTEGYNNTRRSVENYMRLYFAITRNMIDRMKNSLRSDSINLNFIDEMIPHHEGAISMCKNLLQYCIDPRLRTLAEKIISEQSNGVIDLKRIREELKHNC